MAKTGEGSRQAGIESILNLLASRGGDGAGLPEAYSRGSPLTGSAISFAASSYGHLVGYPVAIAGAFIVGEAINLVVSQVYVANTSMVYLLLVILVAVVFGKGPAVVAAVSSFLALSWWFAAPVHSLRVESPGDWVVVLTFLATGLITGQLTANLRQNAHEARLREQEAIILAEMVTQLVEHDLPAMAHALAQRLLLELRLTAVILSIDDGPQRIRETVTSDEQALAYAAGPDADEPLEETAPDVVTAGSDILVRALSPIAPPWGGRSSPARRRWYHRRATIAVGGQPAGAITVVRAGSAGPFSAADGRLLTMVASLLGQTCERGRLRREATEAEILRRSGDVKTALLHAVSHDLRTPLASIMAAAASLLEEDVAWTVEERRLLARTIHRGAGRLNHLVENLLDLSRLEAGMLKPLKEWYDLELLLEDVLGRLPAVTERHRLVLQVADGLPLVPVDYVKIGQVLANLLENASKYTPEGSTIKVCAVAGDREVLLSVADEGPGLPEQDLARLFEPFFRGDKAGSQSKGDGLGLAVAKGLVEAHGGRIWAENRPEGGACFVVALPLYRPDLAATPGEEVGA